MKKGYTLSEVLVVLLVLGIIAAFIIPAVMRTAPDRAQLLYKKSFYATQEAVSEIINDASLYPYDPSSNDPELSGRFYDAQKFCNELATHLNVINPDDIHCESAGDVNNPNFITTNGVIWYGIGGTNFPEGEDGFKEINITGNGEGFDIRIYNDGRVTTGPENDDKNKDHGYTDENKILRNPFRFRDKPGD